MKDEDKTFEDYFAGDMSSTEVAEFSKALENNEALKDKYEFYLAVKKGASLIERDKMRAELDGVEIQEIENVEDARTTVQSPMRGPMLTIIKWVGSIAAVLLISFFSFNTLKPSNTNDLYAQNFETYNVQAARGGDIDALKSFYTLGNYEQFIAEALKVEESPELYMMLANAYLNTGKYENAIKTLTQISDESSLRDQKYWYLGLSQLKSGKSEEAIKNFHHLRAISNYKKQETEEILSIISD